MFEEKTLDFKTTDTFLRKKVAKNIIIKKKGNKWYFTFEIDDQTFRIETQRGKPREWSEPRNLLKFLIDRGIKRAELNLECKNE